MKLEKKVNDLRNATGQNSRLTSNEIVAVKSLAGEFDSKWKNAPSVSPTTGLIDGMINASSTTDEIQKRWKDTPELQAYEEMVNVYYLRSGGAITSDELTSRLKKIEEQKKKALAEASIADKKEEKKDGEKK